MYSIFTTASSRYVDTSLGKSSDPEKKPLPVTVNRLFVEDVKTCQVMEHWVREIRDRLDALEKKVNSRAPSIGLISIEGTVDGLPAVVAGLYESTERPVG